jgi:hypothetical protein
MLRAQRTARSPNLLPVDRESMLHLQRTSCVDGSCVARLFELIGAFVRCGRVSGLFARHTWPLALMVSADQVPNGFADNRVSLTFDGVSRLAG